MPDTRPTAPYISTGDHRPNPIEIVTQGRPVTDTNHSQVHAGNAFHVSEIISSLGAGSSYDITVDIPAGNYVHFQAFRAMLDNAYTISIIEGDTPTTGTESTIIQRHRAKVATTSELTAHDAAVSENTANLFIAKYPATVQGGSGVIEEKIEWVLAAGKSYTFRATNNGVDASDGFIALDWYEESAS